MNVLRENFGPHPHWTPREVTQIRTRKTCCNNPVHTARAKQHVMQQASEWDLAPLNDNIIDGVGGQ